MHLSKEKQSLIKNYLLKSGGLILTAAILATFPAPGSCWALVLKIQGDFPCGTVSSAPAGIDCGFASSNCSYDFPVDTAVTLTASYDSATCRFSSWKDANTGYHHNVDQITVTNSPWVDVHIYAIDADLGLTSKNQHDFSLVSGTVEYQLTIENIGTDKADNLVFVDTLPADTVYVSSTISSGSCNYASAGHQVTCNVSYLYARSQVDISIAVTAPPAPTTLTNQATVSNSVQDLDLTNNDTSETTTVTDQPYTLTISSLGDGTGTVNSNIAGIMCGSDCNEIYPEGKIVTLTAAPDRGSFFTGWSGGNCSGTGSCVLTMDTDKNITANFTNIPPPTIALPKTGQTSCFDDAGTVIDCAGTGQDGETQAGIPWPEPRFEITYCDVNGPCADQAADCDGDAATDMIFDLLTGLTWSRKYDLATGKWDQVIDIVANLNDTTGLGGHTDWHIPNVNELASIVLQQKEGANTSTWLNSQGFVGASGTAVWGSTSVARDGYPGKPYNGYLRFGTVEYGYKTQTYSLWVVRGTSNGPALVRKTGQTLCYDTAGEQINCTDSGQDGETRAGADWSDPNPRFSVIYCDSSGECADQSADCDSDDSTDMVRDNLTGLILMRDANPMGSSGNLQAARDALVTVNNGSGPGGYTDWRMANILELLSLTDYSTNSSTLSQGHPFINTQYSYWSSTSVNRSLIPGNHAYFLDSSKGADEQDKASGSAYLWPIREDTSTADLQISLSDSPDPVQINGSLTYTVEILNNGPGIATDVSLENTLPSEVSFVSAGSTQGSCSHSAGVVTCAMDNIDRNAVSTVSIEVAVGTDLITVENSAVVSGSKNDFTIADNSALETTRISNTDYTLTVNRGGTGTGDVTSNPAGIDCGSGSCSHPYFEASPVVLTATADGSSLFMGWDDCDQVAGNQCTVAVDTDRTVTALFDAVTTADYYVAPGGDDSYTGLGWSRPFQTIAKALSVAQNGEEIWVRAGTYEPPIVSTQYKSSYFTVSKKINLYGGFDGTETDRSSRDPETNKTTVDARRGNGYFGQGFHVDTEGDSGPGRARIDGFVITGGWALGDRYPFDTGGGIIVVKGAPLIANCDIKFNHAESGGGIAAGYNTTIVNCRVHHNDAQNRGGGIQGNSNVQVINSAVYSNYSTYSGGGIAFWSGGTIESSTLTDNWISSGDAGNSAGFHGYYSGTTTINNSIIWGNRQGDNPSEISFSSSGGANGTVSYSNVRGGYTGTGNVDSEPLFPDPADGDLRVQPFVLSIDTGDTTTVPADIADLDGDGNTTEQLPFDIAKNTRIESTVDMGAYEYIPGLHTEYTLDITVAPSAGGTVSGTGWSCTDACSFDYFSGTRVTVSAVPQGIYRFAYWEGCDSSSGDQCTITLDAAKAVTAHMVAESEDSDSDTMPDWWEYYYFHTLDRDGNGDYDGDGLTDKDEFARGTNPDDSDSDDDGMPDGWEVANSLNPTVDDADLDPDSDGWTNLQEYEKGTDPQVWNLRIYTLTYSPGFHGSITGTTVQTVTHGDNGTQVIAVADTWYHFENWSDGGSSATRTDTNITDDLSVTANFSIDTFNLRYTAGANGSISGNTNQTVDYGNNGTAVTAVPTSGYDFESWSDAVATNTRTETNVSADLSVTATFCFIQTWYQDLDGDGYSDGTTTTSCKRPVGYSLASELTATSGDNCPTVANSDQADDDSDGVGNVCVDTDNDGIAAPVDGYMDSGNFVPESTSFSNNFTDTPAGGVTSGTITDRADLTFSIGDSEPGGVSISAAGGTEEATINLCGLDLIVTSGDYGIATCGSLTLEVVSGPMEVSLSATSYVSVPAGVTAQITETSNETFTIENQSGSEPIIAYVAGKEIQIKPGEKQVVTVSFPWTMFMPVMTGMSTE